MRTIVVLSAVAVLAACNSSNDGGIAGSVGPGPGPGPGPVPEVGVFDFNVGEPVAVISATRGDGASVDSDQFTVTFNDKEGTSITITTPEGEEITFNENDPATWIGEDPDLRTGKDDPLAGLPLARLVSDRGDRLEVVIGEVEVPTGFAPPTDPPTDPPVIETEDRLAFAVARLDEHDTRDGFETYTVVGELTDVENLPRHAVDVFDPNAPDVLLHATGDLIEGTAFYDGRFLATVFQSGQVVSDAVTGTADVDIDFAGNRVDITLAGSYVFNDFDDIGVGANGENEDELFVSLTGIGDGDDINFNTGVTYTGDLAGTVDVPADFGFDVETVNVAGEFGGAVFGPGASAFDVLDTVDAEFLPSTDQILRATGTAGVFEANSATAGLDDMGVPIPDPSQDNADVEIVGAFGTESVSFVSPNTK